MSSDSNAKLKPLIIGTITVIIALILVQGFVVPPLTQARESLTWPQTQGTVLISEIEYYSNSDGGTSSRFVILYSYFVGTEEYLGNSINAGNIFLRSESLLLEQYPVNSTITVFYSPTNPEFSVLEPGVSVVHYLYLLVSALFVLYGVLIILLGFIRPEIFEGLSIFSLTFAVFMLPWAVFIYLVIAILLPFTLTMFPFMILFFFILYLTMIMGLPYFINGLLFYFIALLIIFRIYRSTKRKIADKGLTSKTVLVGNIPLLSISLAPILLGFMSMGFDLMDRLGQTINVGSDTYSYYNNNPLDLEQAEIIAEFSKDPLILGSLILLILLVLVVIYNFIGLIKSEQDTTTIAISREKEETSLFCPNCKNLVGKNDSECLNCGIKLSHQLRQSMPDSFIELSDQVPKETIKDFGYQSYYDLIPKEPIESRTESVRKKFSDYSPLAKFTIVMFIILLGPIGLIFYILREYYRFFKNSTASTNWPSVQGTITESRVIIQSSGEGISYRPLIRYNYAVNNTHYQSERIYVGSSSYGGMKGGAEKWVQKFPINSKTIVYYNPKKPNDAVLTPGINWNLAVFILLFLPFLIIPIIIQLFIFGLLFGLAPF